MKKCPECKHEISRKALTCPHCGRMIRRETHSFTMILAIVFVYLVFQMSGCLKSITDSIRSF